jgi:hypothetical protein
MFGGFWHVFWWFGFGRVFWVFLGLFAAGGVIYAAKVMQDLSFQIVR